MRRSFFLALLMLRIPLAGCANPDDAAVQELDPGDPPGKEDSLNAPGLAVGTYSDTAAWTVTNQWEDRNTPEANKAGLAWGENSGLSWDEKFALWAGGLKKIPSVTGWGDTFEITAPYGKTLPAPRMDCADVAILLRVSFAAWYHLPFQMIGYDAGRAVYFGHYGIRTSTGPWSKAPAFGKLADYTNAASTTPWPSDAALRKLYVFADDEQTMIAPGAHLGAWLDEMHLNKRAARFILFTMMYMGTLNLADGRNTYNLMPESLRTGDFLLFRRGTRGTGHTMPIFRVEHPAPGQINAEDAYGNEPPAQPFFEAPEYTARNFMNDEGGGPSKNSDGEIYSHLGGGLKRWRVAKNINGRWTNTFMKGDESSWINDTDYAAIAARPARFGELMGSSDPELKRQVLLNVIEQKRAYLREHPGSCSARTAREEAFGELYQLGTEKLGMTKTQVDQYYRNVDDYIFAPLDYMHSRTCCWNSTTPAMYDLITGYVKTLEQSACVAPPVFKAQGGNYAAFEAYAKSIGRGADWKAWTADEDCPQAAQPDDTLAASDAQPWCSLN